MDGEDNVIVVKSFDFAVRIVKLYKYLVENKQEKVLSKQLLRSGTSVGANIEEAQGAQSKADFFTKISISYKEARETAYWLRLLKAANYLSDNEFESIYYDCQEILNILSSIKISFQAAK